MHRAAGFITFTESSDDHLAPHFCKTSLLFNKTCFSVSLTFCSLKHTVPALLLLPSCVSCNHAQNTSVSPLQLGNPQAGSLRGDRWVSGRLRHTSSNNDCSYCFWSYLVNIHTPLLWPCKYSQWRLLWHTDSGVEPSPPM